MSSLSTYDTSSTWNEMRPFTQSQFSRSQPALLPKLKKSKSKKFPSKSFHQEENFSAVDAFLAQSLPTTPIKRVGTSTSHTSQRKLR